MTRCNRSKYKMMKGIAISTLVLFSVFTLPVQAESLGTFGKTYPIKEEDMLVAMMAKLKEMEASGELAKKQQEMVEKAKASTNRPKGFSLPRASELHTHYYNPEVTMEEAIRDGDGRILYPPGTKANPLDYISLSRQLVFFDGDDEKQKAWVYQLIKDEPYAYKTILTNGPVIDLMKEWEIRLYFDQSGVYSDKFKLTSLPAVIRQEGRLLRIDEIPPVL